MYMSDADKAKQIRKELKESGISNKQVSVKTINSSIYVKIKDVKVNYHFVEKTANKQEDVSYCQTSGEILQGGNTFVFVDFDHDALREAAEQFKPQAQSIYRPKELSREGLCFPISEKDGEKVLYMPHETIPVLEVWVDSNRKRYAAHNTYHLAQAMAIISGQYGFHFDPLPYKVADDDGNTFVYAGMESGHPVYRTQGGSKHIFDIEKYEVLEMYPPE